MKKIENPPRFDTYLVVEHKYHHVCKKGFQVNVKIRKKLAQRKRRIARRLDKTKFGTECPVISASNIHYDVAHRARGGAAGGIGMIHQMVKQLQLDKAINQDQTVELHRNYIALRYTQEQIDAIRNKHRSVKQLMGLSGGVSRAKMYPHAFDADQLYDLVNDPSEQKNVATKPGYSKRLEEMKRLLEWELTNCTSPLFVFGDS